jgi:hypothetical protein
MCDNHDILLLYTDLGENYQKNKSGVAFLMITQGIPQVYT